MAPVELHWHTLSPYARCVALFLKVANIDHTEKVVDLLKGEQHSAEYKKINPSAKVPAIKEGDFILTETVAILQYLAAEADDHWFPKDLQKRAKVNEYLMWHTNGPLSTHYGNIYFHVFVAPVVLKKPIDEAKVDEAATSLHTGLDFLESNFLAKHDWVAGDDISIADIYAACLLAQQESVGLEIGRNRPRVEAWYARVKAKTGPLFDEFHAVLFESNKPYKKAY